MTGLTFKKGHVLDMFEGPAPDDNVLLHETVVERQTNFTNDPGRTGRTRSNILEDVGKSARTWQELSHPSRRPICPKTSFTAVVEAVA
jgi:hypothetical protein